jgi:hypothetical protein
MAVSIRHAHVDGARATSAPNLIARGQVEYGLDVILIHRALQQLGGALKVALIRRRALLNDACQVILRVRVTGLRGARQPRVGALGALFDLPSEAIPA